MARPTTAARRYAEAAFEVALRDGTVEAWRRDLPLAAKGVGDERVMSVLTNPAIPLAARTAVLTEALAAAARAAASPAVSHPTQNLVLLLLHRGRIDLLSRVAGEFKRLDDRRLGITPATATSAAPLEPGEVGGLTDRLEKLTGGRVELDLQVDPGILGGLIVRVGDRLIDGSVRGRLERLRNRLAPGAL